ncbi:aromatic acid exporter family protein [Nocardiopsis sp. CC223A]|uniref:aromatic acid exporter family protein n=1 Tax=Nocardiopsis sp. CC223A TaxID=3044051 RepID=UPI00278C0741|nr:aromatic acid exporter family protein [Nocardiopsis sp. CC223A]
MTRAARRTERLPARAARRTRRILTPGTQERDTALVILKAALAATLAWLVSFGLIKATTPAFAPFAALMMIETTLYRSLLRSLRMLGAVLLGIALTTVLAILAGPGYAVFALAALAALLIGRWRRLGDQGTQVATAAFFAFSVFVSLNGAQEVVAQAAEIFAVVLVGAAIGVAVNLLLLPPLRLRGAAAAVASLAGGLRRLCQDMGEAMHEGRPDPDTAQRWGARTDELLRSARQAREATGTAQESTFYNPRRLLHTDRLRVRDHDRLIDALERAAHQAASIARSLSRADPDDGDTGPAMMARCADLLLTAADAWHVLEGWEDTGSPSWNPPVQEFHAAVERTDRAEQELEAHCRGDGGPPLDDPALPYGVLLVESVRLLDELRAVDEVLTASAAPAR